MRGPFAERAFGEAGDQDAAVILHEAQIERGFGLRDDVADGRRHQNATDLVEDGGDRFLAKPWGIGGKLVAPERRHDRIGKMAQAAGPEGLVLQEARQIEERRAGNIHERANGVRENVLQPRAPAVRPDGAEGGHDAVGDERPCDPRAGVPAD